MEGVSAQRLVRQREAWAGGCRYNADTQHKEPVAARWNGTIWTPLLRYSGGAWQTFTAPFEAWAHDVSVAPSGRIWVTGTTRINSPLVLASP